MDRTVVVGDVHGCCDELDRLVRECGWQPGERLVLVGDLVAKGPDSRGVVERARSWGAQAVLGNHDLHALRARAVALGHVSAHEKPVKPEHQQVVDTLGGDDWRYLERLPLWIRLGPERPGDADTILVHAGAVPGTPWDRQRRKHLLQLRSIRPNGKPTKRITVQPWGAVWPGPERIVFGHDALRGLQLHPYATGLDTGCVYGGRLTALVLPERRLVSVTARRAYIDLTALDL